MSAAGHAPHTEWAETSRCRVVAARRLGAFTALELLAPRVAVAAQPGQFVMAAVPGGGFLLRRPLSLFTCRGDRVGLLVEVRGAGSERLAAVGVGEALELAGPLGTGFPTAGVADALLVGGGIGCAPLQFLADTLTGGGARVRAAFGFRDARQARLAAAFDLPRLWVASEDGSVGRRGTVVDLVETLETTPATRVFCCGPPAMLAAVGEWAAARGLEGYASLEAHMACGTGSCHGCVVATRRGYARVCSEGPVFALGEVLEP